MTSSRSKRCWKTGKVRYHDRVAALLSLSRIQHKDSTKRAKMEQRAYRCPDCNGWHLTSKKRGGHKK